MASFWLCSALLSTLVWSAPDPSTAELDGRRWAHLRPTPETPPGPTSVERSVRLRPVDGGLEVRGRWRLSSARGAWFANALVGAGTHLRSVRIDGRPATTWSSPAGVLLVAWIDGDAIVDVDAFVPGSVRGGIELDLLGSSRGTVVVDDPDGQLRVVDPEDSVVLHHDGKFVTGSARLRVELRPPVTEDVGPVIVARVGIGVTAGDATLEGRARLQWVLRRGTIDSVTFRASDLGADLRLEGPNVARWDRRGDEIHVALREPETRRVDLSLSWSTSISTGTQSRAPMPAIEPMEVFRSESTLQVARDGDVDVVPQLPSWTSIAAAELPSWGGGLVEGTPTAAYRSAGSPSGESTLELLRYVPVPGPPLVVDVTDVRVASSVEGRYVMRARYEVHNERASHLTVHLSAGVTLLGITVAGRPVRPSRHGDRVRIPLPRSLETLDGLVPVPVVLGLLGSGEAWSRRTRGTLPLPSVDAPINAVRVTHVLPRDHASRLAVGTGAVVDRFSRGHDVGYGLDDDTNVSLADELVFEAVDAWNRNDFDAAERTLDELDKMGAKNQATRGIRSNVELIRGPTTSTGSGVPAAATPISAESLVARRIKAQARARASKQRIQYRALKRKAKEMQQQGEYEAAEAEFKKARDEAAVLDALEDAESKTYEFEGDEIEAELEETRQQQSHRQTLERGGRSAAEGEHDLVSTAEHFGFLDETPRRPARPPVVVVLIPESTTVVHHEFLLLEAGATRAIEIHARRPIGRGRRP
jgi:hypothetical protein